MSTLVSDDGGWLSELILPDNQCISVRRDGNGWLSGVIPAGREEHRLTRTDGGLLDSDDPPDVDDTPAPLVIGWEDYSYNADQQWDFSSRSDGESLDPVYDLTTGRLTALNFDEESLTVLYEPQTGQVDALLRSDGADVDLT